MNAEIIRDLGQAITILPICSMDMLPDLSFAIKQHAERRPLGLRLPPGNVANYAIRLVPGDEVLRPEIDLALYLIPRSGSSAPRFHKVPISTTGVSSARAELPQYPVSGQPVRRGKLVSRRPITTPAVLSRMQDHFFPDGIQDHIAT